MWKPCGRFYSVFAATNRCNCSMNRNISTVFGLFPLVWHSTESKFDSRKSQPCWSPSFHEKPWPFVLQCFSDNFYNSLLRCEYEVVILVIGTYWIFSFPSCCTLKPTFQYICWRTDCCCDSPSNQGCSNVYRYSV
jgi:hypothetical protein